MAFWSQSSANEHQNFGDSIDKSSPGGTNKRHLMNRQWLLLAAVGFLVLAVALGVGLGVGLTRHRGGDDDDDGGGSTRSPTTGTAKQIPIAVTPNTTDSTEGSFWRPAAGTSWQIVLSGPLNANGSNSSFASNVSVYDIDLFDTEASTISSLHSQGHPVICYFSAGSYEDWRPDAAHFSTHDYGKGLDGWPGEYWLNTNSSNVRAIMRSRLDLAVEKGCTGIDPDNVDGYDNDNGIGLTTLDAIDYLTFLAEEAHGRNLSIGLKNAGEVVNETVYMMQWSVNEQCVQFEECDLYTKFVDLNKPVFHIEYPKGAPDVKASELDHICQAKSAGSFSTVIKEMSLNFWVVTCGN